ncbi:MAG: cytidyltransferase [Deltaproteobacteria bacterium]|nr:cytidyltransferase [Deltaproteobacteria bacterium]
MFSSSNLLNKFFSKHPEETEAYLKAFRTSHSAEAIIKSLQGLSDLNVLVVGEAILDQYVYSIPLQKAPKEAIVTTRFDSDESFAGGSVAVANHLAGFCREVTLVTCFGPEEEPLRFIRSKLGKNIDLKGLATDDRPTIVKRRFLDKTWMTKMFEMQYLNDADISGETEKELLNLLEVLIPRHDMVVVADFGHGMFTPAIRSYLAECPKFVALNVQTNSANLGFNLATKYQKANYLSIDETELKLAAHTLYGDIPAIARRLKASLGIPNFMVTRGPKGSLFLPEGGDSHETPVFSTKIVDRTGAGDAFFSVTAPCVYRDFDPEVVGFIGNCVGALAVEIVCNREPVDPVNLYKFIQHLLK